MIQRIQTLYLLLALFLSVGLVFIFDMWVNIVNIQYSILSLLYKEEFTLKIIPILFILSGILSFISIFLFRKRNNQIGINRLNILINFILLGMLIYYQLKQPEVPVEINHAEKGIGGIIPIVIVVLLALANKAILKDEKLVKSVDRLR